MENKCKNCNSNPCMCRKCNLKVSQLVNFQNIEPTYIYNTPFQYNQQNEQKQYTPVITVQMQQREEKHLIVNKKDEPSYNTGAWKKEEHDLFLEGHRQLGRNWSQISSNFVKTRNRMQVANHAQKFFQKEIKKQQKMLKYHLQGPESFKSASEKIVSFLFLAYLKIEEIINQSEMSNSQELSNKIEEWFKYDKFDKTRTEIEDLVKSNDIKELTLRLMNRIQFGTAGLRAKMGAGFAFMNNLIVIQTTQGLADYLLKTQKDCQKKGVVIGHDHRFNSEEFALWTARVLLSKGIKVHFYSKMVATPLVPFAVKHLQAAAGIMITASHNPKDDNGYKLYWSNAVQIIPPHDAFISEHIKQNLTIWEGIEEIKLENNNLVSDPLYEMTELYFKEIKKLSKGIQGKEPIVYTAMHGVGTQWTSKAFQTFGLPEFIPVKEQIEPDPKFPTVTYPNPEEGKGALKLAMETAEKNHSKIIIANDPDADRFACAEKQENEWKIFNGNEIALLLADWVYRNYKKKNGEKLLMINSTVSSKILSSMAKIEGFHWEETLTGFKWIGNKGYEMSLEGYKTLFAFEVEIGFIIEDITFDKDGIRTAAVFGEMVNELYKTTTLTKYLDSLYKKYGYYMMKTRYFFCPFDKLSKIFSRIRTMNNGSYPTNVQNYKIISIRDMTTGFDSSQQDKKTKLPPTPDSQMITFNFEDGSTCTLRNSGTEEKIKYYTEVNDKDKKLAEQKLSNFVKVIIEELIQPQENNLKPPPDD